MRRKDREISLQATRDLVDSAEYGILSTVGKDGQPYGVPVNYAHIDGCIYFHCALIGHKLDNIAEDPRVSFCVVGETKILPDQFTTEYESAIAFGVATEVFSSERYDALVLLLEKYCQGFIEEGKQYIEAKDKATRVYKIAIDHMSGKARKSLSSQSLESGRTNR